MNRFSFSRAILFSILAIALTVISCNPVDGDNGDETDNNPKTNLSIDAVKVLSFNTRDGKAVASIDPASDNHLYRAEPTEKSVTLAKIRDDGILESFFKLSADATVDSWPEVEFIVKSTYSNEIYVYFKEELIIDISATIIDISGDEEITHYIINPCRVGKFLCIKEDGTFFDILKSYKENNAEEIIILNECSAISPLVFDINGNMYYILLTASSATANVIYKFEPKTNTSTPMTEKNNLLYDGLLITEDGKNMFVTAASYNSTSGFYDSYLKRISVDNPKNYEDIYSINTASLDAQGLVTSYTVSPKTNTVYYSGNSMGLEKLSGIFSSTSDDYTKSTHDIHSIGADTEIQTLDIFNPTEEYWLDKFINTDGSLNSAVLLKCFKTFIPYPNAVFSVKTIKEKCQLDLTDDTLTDEAALSALTSEHVKSIYNTYFWGIAPIDQKNFLIDGFGLALTDFGMQINYSSQLYVASDGSVWGLTNGRAIAIDPDNLFTKSFRRFYDSEGKPSVYAPSAFIDKDGYEPIKLQMGEGYIYLSCSKIGSEYQTILCMSLTDPDTLLDVFVNVPENTTIKISDYSIFGNTLYFSGLKGTAGAAISGKIDLTNQAFTFTEIAHGFKFNKILAY